MPRYTGEDGAVFVGANQVANVETFTLDITGSAIPLPAMGDSAIVELAGKPRVGGRVRCWWDDTDALGQGALIQGSVVDLELRPLGTGSTLPQFGMTQCEIDSEVAEFPVEGGISIEFTYRSPALPDRTAQA